MWDIIKSDRSEGASQHNNFMEYTFHDNIFPLSLQEIDEVFVDREYIDVIDV